MGTWGTGPFDHDEAGDLVAKAYRLVTEDVTSDDYQLARTGIQIAVLAHGTDILGGVPLDRAVRALCRMRVDREWLSGWKRPREIAAQLDREIRQVLRAIAGCKHCRRAYREELPRLRRAAKAAHSIAVPRRRKPTSAEKRRRSS